MKKYRIELKWGLIFAGMTLLWMAFERAMGWHGENIGDHPTYTNFFAIPATLIYVLALLDKRKNYYEGYMTWLQGFVCGMIIASIVAVLSPLTQWLTHGVISPEYFSNVIEYAVAQGEMSQAEAESYFSLGNYIWQSVVSALVIGAITSAIVALFLQRRPKATSVA